MKRKYCVWLSITGILILFWITMLVMSAFYRQWFVGIGLGVLVSAKIPITIIFGLFIPVVISAIITGSMRVKALGYKE